MTAPADEAKWRSLVSVQMDRISLLVDRFMVRLADDPGYQASGLSQAVLRQTTTDALTRILAALLDPDAVESLETLGHRLGSRRMRDGIPLDSLVSSIRLDFSVIWSALLEGSTRLDAYVIATHAEHVWDVVDTFARSTQTGYLAEQEQQARAAQSRQRQQISLLFEAAGQFEVNYVHIAKALGVSATSHYRVVAIPSESSLALQRNIRRAPAAAPTVFTHELGRQMIAFWEIPADAPLGASDRELRTLQGFCAAVAPVARALNDIPLAALCAVRMLELIDTDEQAVVDLKSAWPLLAKQTLSEIGCDVGQYVFAALRAAAPRDEAQLLETAVAYLRSGSILDTAELLYCHRNTVINRLSRFRELTGLNLTHPADAALALVALADHF